MALPLPAVALPLLAAVLVVVGCGDTGSRAVSAPGRTTPTTTVRPLAPAPSPSAASTCGPPRTITPAPASTTNLEAARRALAAATGHSSRLARRSFTTDLRLVLDSGLVAHATLTGSRLRDGSSSGELRWRGAARLLLPDTSLRIRGNQLALRSGGAGAPWVAQGSASGIALDVGRELFTHGFLLDVTGSAMRGGTQTVRAEARPAELRAYATTERQGLATELLAGATSLRIEARIEGGLLTADVFRLRTQLPQPWRTRLGASMVTVVGRTAACRAAR